MSRSEIIPVELSNLNTSLYRDVLEQLTKDMHLIGIEPAWTEKSSTIEMWHALNVQIDELIRNNPEKVRMLLYRIDLDERIVDHISSGPSEDKLGDLCKQLLIREIQKVILRNQYKSD